LERHHTLRHAVAWSYDLLADTEKSVLERCSVFAGGFDLQSACAVAASEDLDEYVILEVLDALVRKSLLIADRSSGRTRFSMLETIRQFAEEQLVGSGAAEAVRTAHARYFAGREADVMDLWDSPRQRQSYDWFATELPNLRTAFRWAADRADLDVAATVAACSAFLGFLIENYEPLAWAEEMVEPARAVNHPRLAALCVMASQCFFQGRVEEAVGYSDIGASVIAGGGDAAPYGAAESWLGSSYLSIGQPQRSVELCRARLSRGGRTDTVTWASLILWLTVAGADEEAMITADGLIDAAEAIPNPCGLAYALLAYGWVFRDADTDRALEAQRRALAIAQDSGNRLIETQLLMALSGVAARHGSPADALEFSAVAIRKFHESGIIGMLHIPLALLAANLDRLGRYEAAATIAGFAALNPVTQSGLHELGTAITHLREILGDQTYESLARTGESMTVVATVTFAFDQIDQARAELNAVSK
jgi:tetratricopeptide (TPR) repeat protein